MERKKIIKIKNNAENKTVSARYANNLTAKSLACRSLVLHKFCLSVKIKTLKEMGLSRGEGGVNNLIKNKKR